MRTKAALPSTWSRSAAIIERAFQGLLVIVIVGVIYRYCWLGRPSPEPDVTFKQRC